MYVAVGTIEKVDSVNSNTFGTANLEYTFSSSKDLQDHQIISHEVYNKSRTIWKQKHRWMGLYFTSKSEGGVRIHKIAKHKPTEPVIEMNLN